MGSILWWTFSRSLVLGLVVVPGIALAAALLFGVRVIVVKPIGAIPNGVTAIMIGPENANFIDSPDAFCMRTLGYVSLLCRGATLAAMVKDREILARLPYSKKLDDWAGTPETDG